MINRLEKVNETLKHEISFILIEMAREEWGIFTVTDVQIAPDLRIARVWIDGDPKAVEKISEHAHEINQLLRPRIRFRHIPRLKFIQDDETVNHVEELIEKMK